MDITTPAGSTKKNLTGGWRTFIPNTDHNICIGCSRCSKVCPESCITMQAGKDKKKPVTDYDYCKGCGLCAKECPVKAIKMSLEVK